MYDAYNHDCCRQDGYWFFTFRSQEECAKFKIAVKAYVTFTNAPVFGDNHQAAAGVAVGYVKDSTNSLVANDKRLYTPDADVRWGYTIYGLSFRTVTGQKPGNYVENPVRGRESTYYLRLHVPGVTDSATHDGTWNEFVSRYRATFSRR